MTPDQLLPIAEVCSYLSADDQANKMLLNGGFLRPQQPMLIEVMLGVVNWRNTVYPGSDTLQKKNNYLQWLCSPYIGQAQYILNSGGSGQIVNPATGAASSIQEVFRQGFVDGSGTLTLVTGQTSFVITEDFIMNNSLQVTIDTQVITYGAFTDRLSYTVDYTNSDATINIFNGGLEAPENIGLQAPMMVAVRGQKFVSA